MTPDDAWLPAGQPEPRAQASDCLVEHLSNWHAFHSRDVRTYPKVDAVLQVKFENGRIEEGIASEFFPRTGLLPASSIVAWRYIKSEED